jgi:glycerate kinase
MKILVAPNSMKGSLNASDFADVVEQAFVSCSSKFQLKKVPVADGGDFTGEVLQRALNAKPVHLDVQGPLGEKVRSKYFLSGQTAIIEMADASGMKLVEPSLLNPLKASSFGTGQLIADAISNHCTQIWLAIGGSATVDGGAGMLEALGFSFFGDDGKPLNGNGENLSAVRVIRQPEKLPDVCIKILCDVDNPLLGQAGAAAVFAPQKGATPEMVPILEAGLKNWTGVIENECGTDYSGLPGAGAAGGIAIPLLAFYDAEMVAGAGFVLSQTGFEKQVQWADVVVTGEGKIDAQTLNHKAPFAVAQMARKYKKPVFAIGGKVEPEASPAFDGMFSLVNGPVSLCEAMENTQELLFRFSFELAKTLKSMVFYE